VGAVSPRVAQGTGSSQLPLSERGKSMEKAEQIDLETFPKNVFDHAHGHAA
jgi:hypothetical protein